MEEIWERVDALWMVSNKGRVKRHGEEPILGTTVDRDGYYKFSKYFVHREVANHFVENDNPQEKNVVHHLDGNKQNNDSQNLIWISHSEHNKFHSLGDKNPMKGRTGDKNPMYGRRGENNPNYGRKMPEEVNRKLDYYRHLPCSEEHKKKISEKAKQSGRFKGENNPNYGKDNSGIKNPNAKLVIFDGLDSPLTIKDMSKIVGKSTVTLSSWLKGRTPMPSEWKNKNLRYFNR